MTAEEFLARLARDRAPFDARIAVVVAHPDDETIGCGAQLSRFPRLSLIHVTDGAPRSLSDARARGFATADAYAAARRRELEAAVALAGVRMESMAALGVPDQEAARRLRELVDDLAIRIAGFDVAITHSYEGGHPDHDATAFAVQHAAERIGARAPAIVEMPLYRAGPDGRVAQSFSPAPGDPRASVIALAAEQIRLKEKMFSAYATQAGVLGWFSVSTERFRPAPKYDFRRLPNGGALLYEHYAWGMTGDTWLACVRAYYGSE
jgi:LmbE family N-acetylglucosaminyl deacetylase